MAFNSGFKGLISSCKIRRYKRWGISVMW